MRHHPLNASIFAFPSKKCFTNFAQKIHKEVAAAENEIRLKHLKEERQQENKESIKMKHLKQKKKHERN